MNTTIRRYFNNHFPNQADLVMVFNTILEQDLEIDFGYLGKLFDDESVMRKGSYRTSMFIEVFYVFNP